MADQTQIDSFLLAADKAAKMILETVQQDGFIDCFSHLDADGVAAAGIISKALYRLDARYRVRVMQWVDDKIINDITADKSHLVILTDFGSGYLQLLNEKIPDTKIAIMDHHQITTKIDNPNFAQVNPHEHDINGATDVSGSGVTYFVAKALNPKNVDLSPVALVGALGDMQDKYDQRSFGGLNELILKDATQAGLMKVEKDLTFFGRETRPIHRTLATTTTPFIPGLSGEEDKALAFLSTLHINLKQENGRIRALSDLDADEKKCLCSALADYMLSKGLHVEVSNLVGNNYVLVNEESNTALRDAREYSVLLNSTGRMNRPSLGIAICMGDRGAALEESNNILEDYRKNINKYLGWVTEKPERLRELDNIYVINGEDYINEKIIGTVSSIMVAGLANNQKPLIAYAKVDGEDSLKISSRTTEAALQKGVNLSDVMRLASEKHSGKGGGHNIAAGAQVPLDQIEGFIATANELVERQLKGESLADNNNA
ncbi:MAG: DHH family phosphoesterase [Nitrososphaerota archaeon]|jgi:RecJ-like exonuclease|nr:DHH family phosphoesterase [Nitrososphaerota archaeon]